MYLDKLGKFLWFFLGVDVIIFKGKLFKEVGWIGFLVGYEYIFDWMCFWGEVYECWVLGYKE